MLFVFAFQPKLTMPKCQKNVDYFLEACRKLGVDRVRMNFGLFSFSSPQVLIFGAFLTVV